MQKHSCRLFIISMLALVGNSTFTSCNHSENLPLSSSSTYNFYIIADFGSVKTSGTKVEVAAQMNQLAPIVNPQFIISCGDNFHNAAPLTVKDTSWEWNFVPFFNHGPIAKLKWYVALGNHDYAGNPDAQITYHQIDTNWVMPARYFTFVKTINDSTSLRVVIMDSSPFLKSYTHKFPAISSFDKQNTALQLHWADSVLANSHETWKIVIAHHPIYSSGFFPGNTKELITQLDPILRKYHVDFYFSGHIHTFQHNQKGGIDYVTTGSAWQSRTATPWFYTKYWKKATGFTLCSVTKHHFAFYFINDKGKVIYSYERKK